LAETAMLFNGIDLAGRQLKIGHPNGERGDKGRVGEGGEE
jgi:hypothetical protein